MRERNEELNEDTLDGMRTVGRTGPVGADEERSLGGRETARRTGIVDDGRTDAARRWKAGEEILGRYVVEKELGQGGMGVVYECLDKVGGVKVAVKCLPPELSHNSVEMEEVRDNYQLVHGLSHQNIAGVLQLEKDARGEYFLVMDVARGEPLRRWIRRKWKSGGVKLPEAIGVLRQVASALDYAHGERVVHRDVKPGNVMIDGRGRVKVLDFGLAAQIRTSLSRASQAYRGTSGTGPYMAPEQWEGKQQDGKADQYALGVMAYEMLSGHLPFENSELAVLKDAVLHGAADPIPGFPKVVMGALRRAMAKRKEERFGSCGEFVKALAGGSGRRNARSKTLMGWGAALVLAAAVGVWVWWGGWGREETAGEPSAPRQEETEVETPAPPVEDEVVEWERAKQEAEIQQLRNKLASVRETLRLTQEQLESALAANANAARTGATASGANSGPRLPAQGRQPAQQPPAKTAAKPPAKPAQPATPGVYVVQSGDTFSKLATRFHTTTETLYAMNRHHLASPNSLRVGMKLVVPQRQDGQDKGPDPVGGQEGIE